MFVRCINQLRPELDGEDAEFGKETSADHGLVSTGGDHGAVVQRIWVVRVPLLMQGERENEEKGAMRR